VIKDFSRDVVIYGVGLVVMRLATILVLPFVTSLYSIEEVGRVELIVAFSRIAAVFVLLNVDTALTFFFWDRKKDSDSQKSYIVTATAFVLVMALVGSLLIILLNPVFERIYYVGSAGVHPAFIAMEAAFYALHVYFLKTLRLQRRAISYNVANVLFATVFLGGVVLLFRLGGDPRLHWYFVAHSAGMLVAIALSVFFVRDKLNGSFSVRRLRDMFGYALPLVPFSVASLLMTVTDKWFVNFYQGSTEVGAYAMASKLANIVSIFVAAFAMTFGPFAMSVKDRKNASEIYAAVFDGYVLISLTLVMAIQFSARFLSGVFVRNYEFHTSVLPLFGVLAFGLFVHSLYGQLSVGLHVTRKTKYISYGSIFALFANIALNLYFVREFGMIGASISTLVSYVLVAVWIYFVSGRFFPVVYDWKFLLSTTGVFLSLVGVFFWILNGSSPAVWILFLALLALFAFLAARKALSIIRMVRSEALL
jgi:O-antigen/teichoic acid export membrane protein